MALNHDKYIEDAIRAVQETKRPPEIDFTIHTLEDGTEVSTLERVCKDIPQPARDVPKDEELWAGLDPKKPNTKFLKDHLFREGRLSHEQALWIIRTGAEIFRFEPTVLELGLPITICGDVHGQYYDLLKIFEVGGDITDTNYLFLGDYVNRGYFSVECLLYLWSLKICHPNSIHLLRGNHDCRYLGDYFTFRKECEHKYSTEIYEAFLGSFNCLPLAAVVNKQHLCVHGGIGPELKSIEDIKRIDRFCEPPTQGLFCDILWSDPLEDFGKEEDKEPILKENNVRGCSIFFSYKTVCKFLDDNNLLSIIRGHEAQESGYQIYRKNKTTGFPSLITVFSAPNYLDTYNNFGAVLKFTEKTVNVRQFRHSPHPYLLPNFMDVFTWSLPFVGEKLTDMIIAMLSSCSDEELYDRTPGTLSAPLSTPGYSSSSINDFGRSAIKAKIVAVGRLGRVFRILREEVETIDEYKAKTGSKLPAGTLMLGRQGIREAFKDFEGLPQKGSEGDEFASINQKVRKREERSDLDEESQAESERQKKARTGENTIDEESVT